MANITFVANQTSGTSPFYVTFYDLSNVSDLTSATDYDRTWFITNNRTSITNVEITTSGGFNYKFEGNLNDTFTITLSALHVSASSTSTDYIFLRGPTEPSYRFDDNREINLVNFLPGYLQETEFNDLVQFFQDFLNTLYDEKLYTTSASDYEISNRPKISILEKINRLSELQDPDFIDIEYINYFANSLGYSVDVSRGELGILADQNSNDPSVQEDVKRYLRFVLESLPSWFRIKTTNNAIKIMLYSFGLVGDLLTRFTNDYRQDIGNNWINFREGIDSFEDVPKDFYPTPHYVISIELDQSNQNFSLNDNVRLNVMNAVESIRPANTVNDGYLGHVRRNSTEHIRIFARKRVIIKMVG